MPTNGNLGVLVRLAWRNLWRQRRRPGPERQPGREGVDARGWLREPSPLLSLGSFLAGQWAVPLGEEALWNLKPTFFWMA
ncbi:hypothetical protein Mlute_02158 [Meiothermus luteus]|uniref:Uncharacterized protein n=1 Tax=Meiothermus luteus TaxID=2026184 RepID=A0A399EHB5_9DEIN|nr:hypothetical protein [Meiothermus luteus]RIH83545.1 hypothetical protein Mlute_02158 [Meiothermus luteus]RMH53358.1 MAG: hypothetical protein D6684_12745 [Deinococcota bacterium]